MISDIEIPFTKILRPTAEEFQDFEKYVEMVDHDKYLQEYGLVKVIPPAKWKARQSEVSAEFEELSVHAPIEQNVQGKSGVYELLLIQKKSMRINEYRKKIGCFDALTDDKSVEEVEEMFWKSLAFSPPLYGADMAGSLFEGETPWNLNELPGILNEGLVDCSIAGVNSPYLYIGSWKAMFGWHKEDLDLYSINYLHYGKPKFWYCMPPSEAPKLENFAKSFFPESFNKCKEFLRHKTLMIHPYLLKQKIPDLKIHKIQQNPGEFILTSGGAYHAGFNWGFNIAEAVNYATSKWLEIFPKVEACKCISDTVKIDKAQFFQNIANSNRYTKNAFVKKICADNGAVKPKNTMKIEDEVLSSETADSRTLHNTKKGGRSKKNSKDLDIDEEKSEEVNSNVRKSSRVRVVKKNLDSDDEADKKAKKGGVLVNSKKIKKEEVEETKITRSGRKVNAPKLLMETAEEKRAVVGRPKKVKKIMKKHGKNIVVITEEQDEPFLE